MPFSAYKPLLLFVLSRLHPLLVWEQSVGTFSGVHSDNASAICYH